ncbi:hypothetical protein GGR57DRAFT_451356 [Xylariaceae sp. FL1272]|nr:hypothetical protein GGR57DRAFT_451356 [Xylariaceae sp. FL1272]
MKFFLAITALATTTLAATAGLDARGGYPECTPPSYACKSDYSGWLVCNVDGKYLDGGVCPKHTKCEYINNLPYCV